MTSASRLPRLQCKSIIGFGLILGMMLGGVNLSFAGNREQAWRIFERLTGTPPSQTTLDAMSNCLASTTVQSGSLCDTTATSLGITGVSDGPTMATYIAMKNPNFLSVTVKNMVTPWTNKDQTVFFPLNDASATIIGLIRDGEDFRQSLYADVLYYDPNLSGNFQLTPFVNQPSSNNLHYEYIEHKHLDLQDPSVLQKTTQTSRTGIPAEGVAGVMTTRAMQRAFFYAGTNRAMLRFTFLNFLCNDFGQIKDVTSNPERVRQDPSRSPGGDSSVYLNNCVGCHAGMDGMAGAFAYYNWGPNEFDDSIPPDTQGSTYNSTAKTFAPLSGKTFPATRVVPKYLQNFLSFPEGYETSDDSWENYWRVGLDANLGWGWGDGTGNSPPHEIGFKNGASNNPYPSVNGQPLGSAAQLGYELANTHAFARCQVLHAYRQVCSNDPTESKLATMVSDFKGSGFNMLTAFSDAALDCSSNLQ